MRGEIEKMKRLMATAGRARRTLVFLGVILTLLVVALAYSDVRSLTGQYKDLAAEMGRSFFAAIDTMREWNLKHGGIYVRAGGDVQPSPYLPESVRKTVTVQGESLTLVSHAHMTRLISELLTNQRGIHLHIASLRPIRPGNSPDSWERHALAHFAQGSSEEYDIFGEGREAEFKYMAPLRMRPACLLCHQETGDTETVRGGISVSFSYDPFLKVLAVERRKVLLTYAVFLAVGLMGLLLMGRKLVQSIDALQDLVLRIRRLEGLLPICAHCKKIRLQGADRSVPESWIAVEKYIADRTDAEFTHGLCPTCVKEFYPQHDFKKGG